MIMVLPSEVADQMGNAVVAVDGAAYLASVDGRRCPDCGATAVVGNGSRPRAFQTEPVRRGRPRPRTSSYRIRCKACRHCHTILPPQLGPHKRYTLAVIEAAVRAQAAGEAVSRISARLGGISPDRIATWERHFTASVDAVRGAIEAIVIRAPLFHLPAVSPTAGVFTYLAILVGMAAAPGLFVAINCLLSLNLPLAERILLHPPTSDRRTPTPWPTRPPGGMPFG